MQQLNQYEVAFIFGAGASADLGVPMMAQFGKSVSVLSDELTEQHNIDEAFEEEVLLDLQTVTDWLRRPDFPQFEWFDPGNLEHIFCLWEMESEIGKPGGRKRLDSLLSAIAYTIEKSYRWEQWNPPGERVPASKGYVKLLRILRSLYLEEETRGGEPAFGFVTLNYDLCLEDAWQSELAQRAWNTVRERCYADWYANYFQSVGDVQQAEIRKILEEDGGRPRLPLARYGLIGREEHELSTYPVVLKLHGSANWGICPTCGNVREFPIWFDKRLPGPETLRRLRDARCRWHPETQWENAQSTAELRYVPLLVPPSLGKTGQCATIREVWRRATEVIGQTRRLVFVGYSLPESDMHFKYLLAAGLAGRTQTPNVMVVNLHKCEDQEQESKDRFSRALGVDFDEVDRHCYINRPFSESVDDIAEFLQRPV